MPSACCAYWATSPGNPLPLPDSFTPSNDTQAAAWLQTALEPHWGRQPHANYVAAIVPRGYPAYARLFHPAHHAHTHRPITWQAIATRFGSIAHAQMQWHSIVPNPETTAPLPEITPPATGSLPQPQLTTLTQILQHHTATVDTIHYAIWQGWGALEPSLAAAQFTLPDRAYYLLHGPLAAATHSLTPHHHQSANLWWPQDRAWCVATEIDMMWTYIGGTHACIAAILASEQLEAWPATLDDRADIHGDQRNRNKS